MCDLQPKRPTSVQKLLFWGILGALSVLFAEVTVGSSPFAFFDAWGLLVVGLGMLVRPEALPALGPQASVWLLYAAAIAGLWLGLRRPRPASLFGLAESPDRFSWRLWFGLATVLVVTATGSRLLLGSGTWLKGKERARPVFNMLDKTARMMREDLKGGREAWLKEAPSQDERRRREASSFLICRDGAGKVADFHALRHTFISRLVRSGANIKVARELARHSGAHPHAWPVRPRAGAASDESPGCCPVDRRGRRRTAGGQGHWYGGCLPGPY